MTGPWRRVVTSLVLSSVLAASFAAGAGASPPKSGEGGQGGGTDAPATPKAPKVKAKLLAERPVLIPGKTAVLGLHFTIQPEWHIYSNSLSDSGSPPTPQWTLPPGFKVEPMLWPAPMRHKLPGDILDHIYEKDVMLLVPVSVPADAKPGTTVKLAAELSYMVCKDVCVIERQPVSIELPVEAADVAQVVADPKFSATRARLPKPVKLGKDSAGERAGISASWSDATLKIQVKDAKALTFYPIADSLVPANPIAECVVTGDTLAMRFGDASADGSKSAPVHGVLEIKRAGARAPETGVEFYEFSVPRPPAR